MIFVDLDKKKILEQHLDGYATWMPYGFGEESMLGLYPTNNHTEEEIISELKKYGVPYYTEVTEAVVLDESGNDEADEAYKGIFIDRKTGDFKILSGRFPDKKAMITKYGSLGKDYIARKVFEKPVFDWILNNAKSSLDSYLMFSTAFSKWKHNSILDKYYMKLINDMPQLFNNVRAKDKIGGDNASKKQSKESMEMDEAEYRGNSQDQVHNKIYFVAYGENGKILVDYTNRAPVSYERNSYNFESVELFKILELVVKSAEEETGEEVENVAVKTSKKDPTPRIYSREQIEKGYTPDVGRVYDDEKAFQKTLDDPDSEELQALIYCRDEKGRRIIVTPYPAEINHIIEKGNGIDDRQVWITALQTLNTAGKYDDGDEVFIIDPTDGKEKFANRRSVVTNVHNMEPGQNKPIMTKNGNIAHPLWSKVKFDLNMKDYFNTMRQRNQTVVRHSVNQSPINRMEYLKKAGVSPEQNASMHMSFGNTENKESNTQVRQEVKNLIEAYKVYDLPNYSFDPYDIASQKDIVKLLAKNDFGKDDLVVLHVDMEDERSADDIEAAAQKLKNRNPGKQIFFQINDEPEQEYGW